MIFDEFMWPESAGECLPAGTRMATIQSAQETCNSSAAKRFGDANPEGVHLSIRLAAEANGKRYFVDTDAPAHWRGLIEAICDAAGVDRPIRDEDWDCGELVGRRVLITTDIYTGRDGDKAQVKRWAAPVVATPPAAAVDVITPTPVRPPAVRRTPAQKAAATTHNATTDDIPF